MSGASRRIQLEGQRFNRWLVGSYMGKELYSCTCDCGAVRDVLSQSLRKNVSTSCGCYIAEKNTIDGYSNHAHAGRHRGVISRCNNSDDPDYPSYGGRGIKVYDPWVHGDGNVTGQKLFCDWLDKNLGTKPDGHSLDRIDNDKGYEPGNLKWSTQAEQLRNRRSKSLWDDSTAPNDFVDITGQTFGHWSVLSHEGKSRFLCRCKCGKERSVTSQTLREGRTTSCGCRGKK